MIVNWTLVSGRILCEGVEVKCERNYRNFCRLRDVDSVCGLVEALLMSVDGDAVHFETQPALGDCRRRSGEALNGICFA